MRKALLVLTEEYPPKTSPTALAASIVIQELKKEFDVHCICFDKKIIIKNRGKKSFVGQLFFRLQQLLTIPIYPVFHPLRQMYFNLRALNYVKNHSVDCVIGVSFPFESIVASNYIKKKFPKIKFVAYLIDAFSCGTPPKYLPVNYSLKKRLMFERKNVCTSDLIIAMEASKEFNEVYNKNFYYNIKYLNPAFFREDKIQYNKSSISCQTDPNKYIKIIYTGYLYKPDRNPEYILRLISSLNMPNVQVIFVGDSSNVKDIIEKQRNNFCGKIQTINFVPHEDLCTILEEADFFLNLGVSNGNAISGKIFEYMSYGKPIISMYIDNNEATIPYLKKYGLSCVLNVLDDFEVNRKKLALFINKNYGRRANLFDIRNKFYSSTPQAFVDEIKKLVRR